MDIFWEICCGLDLVCPLKVYVMKVWSQSKSVAVEEVGPGGR